MAFDVEGFTNAARQKGYSEKQIQTFLEARVKSIEAGRKLKTGAFTEEEQKQQKKVESIQGILDSLSTIYYGKEGEKSLALVPEGEYRLPAQLTELGTKFQAGKANSIEKRIYEYNRLKSSKMAFFAKAYGDTGNIAYQEQLNAIRSLPEVSTSPGEALTLWDTAYSSTGAQPSSRLQNEFKKSNYQRQTDIANQEFPQESIVSPSFQRAQENTPAIQQQQLNPLEQLLAPIAQGPIGGGAEALLSVLTPAYKRAIQKAARGEQVSLGEGVEAGGDILTAAIPALRLGRLGLAGKAALAGGVRGATRDIPLEQRPLEAGKEAAIGGLLGNILRPKTIPGAIREAGIKRAGELKIDLTEAAKLAKEYVERVPIADTGPVRKTIESLSKQKNVSLNQAFQRLSEWGDLTYKPSGIKQLFAAPDPKTTATAHLYNILYGNVRKQIAKKAPLASAGQTGLSAVNKVGGALGKVGSTLGFGALATAGGGALYKLFPGLFER